MYVVQQQYSISIEDEQEHSYNMGKTTDQQKPTNKLQQITPIIQQVSTPKIS